MEVVLSGIGRLWIGTSWLPPRYIQYPVLEEPLRVWKPAGTEGTIGLKVLMYHCNLVAVPVQICNTLAPGAKRYLGLRRSGMMLPDHTRREFAGAGSLGVLAVVEHLTQFAWTDLTSRGDERHGTAA